MTSATYGELIDKAKTETRATRIGRGSNARQKRRAAQ
jgi:hypothetical protein